jgi:hypothetical protein
LAAQLEPAIVEQMPALLGRERRRLTVAELEALGHTKQPLLRVIRTNCVECCAGNEAEVRRCGMHWCPFWPYRMASNPFAAPKSEAQLAAFEKRLARTREGRSLRAKSPEGAPQRGSSGPASRALPNAQENQPEPASEPALAEESTARN